LLLIRIQILDLTAIKRYKMNNNHKI
jgi:hypothetical protein